MIIAQSRGQSISLPMKMDFSTFNSEDRSLEALMAVNSSKKFVQGKD